MSDPAVDAAQHALDQRPWFGYREEEKLALIAAREALKPIRELHKRITMCDVSCCQRCRTQDGALAGWPCATAKLIYTSEELA